MRAGIGLVGLLVCVGLLMYLFAETQIPVARVGKQAQGEAQQISGHGQDGGSAMDSFATDPDYSGSKLRGLVVTSVTPGGAMQTYFGLQTGDRITEINGNSVNDISNSDEEMAKALAAEAFQRRQTLTVERNGQALTLPAPAGSAAAAPGGTPAAAPGGANAEPAPAAPRRESSPLGDQLRGIQDAAAKRGEDE